MRIISKYKDYYDFCSKKYGVDDKIIYDRKEFVNFLISGVYYIAFCGTIYRIIITENKEFYFGDEYNYDRIKGLTKRSYYIKTHLTKTDLNEKHNEPVLISNNYRIKESFSKNPVLSEFGFTKIMTPEECWVSISNFLSRSKFIEDNRTDKDKIISHGFDLKKSFRNL